MGARDQRRTNARYYERNRLQELRRVRQRQDTTRDFLRRLRGQPCDDCGEEFLPHQMDFDHRDPREKSFRLTAGRAMLMARDRLVEEVAKCDVVCANCHRVRTFVRAAGARKGREGAVSAELERKRAYWRAQAAMLDRLKRRPCHDCGTRFPSCAMDFDHREPGSKQYTVSRMIGRAGNARIAAEVAKCDIVCANCHRDRTYRRRMVGSSGRE